MVKWTSSFMAFVVFQWKSYLTGKTKVIVLILKTMFQRAKFEHNIYAHWARWVWWKLRHWSSCRIKISFNLCLSQDKGWSSALMVAGIFWNGTLMAADISDLCHHGNMKYNYGTTTVCLHWVTKSMVMFSKKIVVWLKINTSLILQEIHRP